MSAELALQALQCPIADPEAEAVAAADAWALVGLLESSSAALNKYY